MMEGFKTSSGKAGTDMRRESHDYLLSQLSLTLENGNPVAANSSDGRFCSTRLPALDSPAGALSTIDEHADTLGE